MPIVNIKQLKVKKENSFRVSFSLYFKEILTFDVLVY